MKDKLRDVEKDLDKEKLIFVGSNWEKFNFSTFKGPLDFLLDIYHGEITLKEAEFFSRKFKKWNKKAKIWL